MPGSLFYGWIYDAHSEVLPGGDRSCSEGLKCYQSAYFITLVSSFLGIFVCLFCIHHNLVKSKEDMQDSHREA